MGTSPATAFSSVVFPDPFVPKIATTSPGRASRVTPRTALTWPNITETFLIFRCTAIPVVALSWPGVMAGGHGEVLRQVGGLPLPGDPAVLDRHDAVAHLRKDERVVRDEEEGDPVVAAGGTQ